MAKLFDEKIYNALRKQVRKELEPMRKAIFEYHLKGTNGNKKRKTYN